MAARASDPNNCLGRRCPHYGDCFFYKARRKIEDAHVLIVNHHLYFSDLSLRDEHAGILPNHQVVIFDEAHGLEETASSHLGVSVSEAQIRFFLQGLWNAKGQKGILSDIDHFASRDLVEQCEQAALRFWQDVAFARPAGKEETFRLHQPDMISNSLAPMLVKLARLLDEVADTRDDDDQAMELRAHRDKATDLAMQLHRLVEQLEQFVYYATVPDGRGTMSLSANPLSVAELLLRDRLFESTETVIMTSATIAADDSERFLFFRRRVGVDDGQALRLDSPFDYHKQGKLLVNASALDPNGPQFERAPAQWAGDYLQIAPGGAFMLFTSYRQLEAVYNLLAPRLERSNRFVLRQGSHIARKQMIDLFKSTGNAVLFGTATFWEGVDIRGDALQHVIIAKLPFEMPDHPLIEARHQAIKQRGGNPFMERTVPEAILKLKQGVGRLIRTTQDRGTVAICDHRVLTKQYGRYFLRALPDMPVEQFKLADALVSGQGFG